MVLGRRFVLAGPLAHVVRLCALLCAGVTPLPSADQDLESDQEKASPFADPDTFKTATSSEGSMEGLDDVPDVSPMACSTLRQHLSVVPDRFDMEWQEMGCSYNIGGSTKVVLQDVWGRAKPGEMQVGAGVGATAVKLLQRLQQQADARAA